MEIELKHAEDALAVSEHDLRRIVDSIPGMVAVFSAAGELQFVNNQVIEYFGVTLEELKNWEGGGYTHPEDTARSVELFIQSIASEQWVEHEVRARRFDGVYRWFQSRGHPLRDASGRIERWCNLLTDIDDRKCAELERKRAEDALAVSERDLRLMVDSIPGMVTVFSAAGELQFVNNQVLEYFGGALGEHKNWKSNGFTHPEDTARCVEAFTRSIASGEPFDLEVRARRFDGVYRWFQSRGKPLRDASGRVVRWYNLLTDIDDQKRAESELKRANEYLTIAQQLSQTGSYTREMATDEQNLSDQMYRICEFDPAKKVTHEMVWDRVHPEDVPAIQQEWSAALEAGKEVKIAYRFVTDSGVVKHFRTISRPMVNATGGLTYIGATQDVTEIKLAEEAASQARAELAHVARVLALCALTATIAHEVNQPLAGIVTNASTCLRMLSADPANLEGAKATAQRTIRDANRASEVIRRLRALFARKQPIMEPLDLNDIAGEVLALYSGEFQRRQVAVQTDFAEDLPVVRGDRVQLQQVILNLIRNATDAMSAICETSRNLMVETRCEDTNRVRLSVRDSGVGIDPQNAEKMFDTFYTTKPEGMGIGLSVSRSIMESHDGRLWATANEGPGATFAFSIPCGLGSAQEIVKPDAHDTGAGSSQL